MSEVNNKPQNDAPQGDDQITGVASYFIRNKVISWMLSLIFLIGGVSAFFGLGRLEDPAFTIKDAMVVTSYPGATPQQVEEEVTYPLEKAIQQLTYVDEVNSISSRGLSQVTVTMKNNYGPDDLPQIWDELRRKVNDLKVELPPGVNDPQVIDDFGDVYGILLAVTGDGYSYKELLDYIDYLRRELELVDGVSKVSVSGQQQEQVFIEISMKRISSLGISPSTVFNLLSTQNIVSSAGAVRIGDEYIRIHPTGEFQNVEQLGDLILTEGGAQGLIYLKDVADVTRGYVEVPTNIIGYNGKLALNLGVSFAQGVNVVAVGEAFDRRLAELKYQQPVGIDISEVYNQPKEVDKSVSGFVVSLGQAVAIVIIVLLFFHGASLRLVDWFDTAIDRFRYLHFHAVLQNRSSTYLTRRIGYCLGDAGGQRHCGGGRDIDRHAKGTIPDAGRHRYRHSNKMATARCYCYCRYGFCSNRSI